METHLVDVMAGDDVVKHGVEIVENLDDLHGGALCTQSRKANDVREIHSDAVVHLGLQALPALELLRHDPIHRNSQR